MAFDGPTKDKNKKFGPKLQTLSPEDIIGAARALPNAHGPEQSILSTMMQEPQEYIGIAVEERLNPAYFYVPAHATLYTVLNELYEKGQPIELVSLALTRPDVVVVIGTMIVATYVHSVVDNPSLFPLQPKEPIIPLIVIVMSSRASRVSIRVTPRSFDVIYAPATENG